MRVEVGRKPYGQKLLRVKNLRNFGPKLREKIPQKLLKLTPSRKFVAQNLFRDILRVAVIVEQLYNKD